MTSIDATTARAVRTSQATEVEADGEQAPAPAPGATPGTGQKIVISGRGGVRSAMRISGGVLAAAGIGAALLTRNASFLGKARMPLLLGAGAAGVALAGASFLVHPKTAAVLETGIASREEAVARADALNADIGIQQQGKGFRLIGFSGDENLDNRDRGDLRVGDGRQQFDRLVTRDGDVLVPTGARGYGDSGSAAARTDTSRADLDQAGALRGLQLGTDDEHRPITVGDRVGAITGDVTAAAKAAYAADPAGEHLIVTAGSKVAAFDLDGPSVRSSEARGTTLSPIGDLKVQSGKAVYRAAAAGGNFDFAGRILPFSSDEPVGQRVRIPGTWTGGSGIVRDHLTQVAGRDDAIIYATGRAALENLRNGRYGFGDGYVVIRGDGTGPGDPPQYHVYGLDTDAYSSRQSWDDRMGHVEAVVHRDSSQYTRRNGDYLEYWERDTIKLAESGRNLEQTLLSDERLLRRDYDPQRTNNGVAPQATEPAVAAATH